MLVSLLNNFYYIVVLAIAANKADLYEHEEIEEGIGREFADQVGAIFRYTSAKNSSGIDELFSSIGDKILNPQKKEEESIQQAPKDKKVILYNSPKDKPKEGGCCK